MTLFDPHTFGPGAGDRTIAIAAVVFVVGLLVGAGFHG
jgi:hypothetical protein